MPTRFFGTGLWPEALESTAGYPTVATEARAAAFYAFIWSHYASRMQNLFPSRYASLVHFACGEPQLIKAAATRSDAAMFAFRILNSVIFKQSCA